MRPTNIQTEKKELCNLTSSNVTSDLNPDSSKQELLSSLFQPHFRLHPHLTQLKLLVHHLYHQGHGLGLGQGVVRSHLDCVACQTGEGQGAGFWVPGVLYIGS